ncbi:MAG: hypothetical protein ACRETL_14610, partial [Gammaproteobacteria bacterium]
MSITIEISVDEKNIVRRYLRGQGIVGLMQLVREIAEEYAVPPETGPDATPEGVRCYVAIGLLDADLD